MNNNEMYKLFLQNQKKNQKYKENNDLFKKKEKINKCYLEKQLDITNKNEYYEIFGLNYKPSIKKNKSILKKIKTDDFYKNKKINNNYKKEKIITNKNDFKKEKTENNFYNTKDTFINAFKNDKLIENKNNFIKDENEFEKIKRLVYSNKENNINKLTREEYNKNKKVINQYKNPNKIIFKNEIINEEKPLDNLIDKKFINKGEIIKIQYRKKQLTELFS